MRLLIKFSSTNSSRLPFSDIGHWSSLEYGIEKVDKENKLIGLLSSEEEILSLSTLLKNLIDFRPKNPRKSGDQERGFFLPKKTVRRGTTN
jgi:hypothetical protein